MVAKSNQPFWKTKNLAELSQEQWESLCDGCGKCCCIRLEDEDDGSIYITDVACRLFNPETCACSGSRNTIHEKGMSVQDAVVSEDLVEEEDVPHRIVIWPVKCDGANKSI